eukprot:scaffold159929_cov20-Prasinocladus_malaysianus.AAC.2
MRTASGFSNGLTGPAVAQLLANVVDLIRMDRFDVKMYSLWELYTLSRSERMYLLWYINTPYEWGFDFNGHHRQQSGIMIGIWQVALDGECQGLPRG